MTNVAPIMQAETSKPDTNLNISAFRLLYLFRLLSQRRDLTLKELNNLLLEHEWIGKLYTPETIRKYFYTLQRVGVNIETFSRSDNSRYQLSETPFNIVFSDSEKQAATTVLKILLANPMKSYYKTLGGFLKWLNVYQEDNDKSMDISFDDLANMEQLLAKYEKYCFEGCLIEVTTNLPHLQKFKFYPQSIEFQGGTIETPLKRNFTLCGHTPESHHRLYIPIHVIESCKQISKTPPAEGVTTVIFKLTGRLVKNYRLYPGEQLLDKGDYLLVKNRTDELQPLLWRLMRYGQYCEIISPTEAREEVQRLIDGNIEALEFHLTDSDLKIVDKLLKR